MQWYLPKKFIHVKDIERWVNDRPPDILPECFAKNWYRYGEFG